MDDQSLRNVLGILRLLQNRDPNTTPAQFIHSLAGPRISQSTMARTAAYLLDQFALARQVIDNSQLVEEAKAGVRIALDRLNETFAVGNLNNSWASFHSSLAGYISNFVILLSAAGLSTDIPLPQEASDLASEIDEFLVNFDDPQLDPLVRDVARQHMAILSTLIRHIPIFGMEAALTTYFELVMKLRRVDSKSSEKSKGKLDALMGTVKSWGERLKTVDSAVNSGANLIERAQGAGHLLQYIPDLIA